MRPGVQRGGKCEKYQAKSKSNRAVIPWMLLSRCRECSEVEASSERFKPLVKNEIRAGKSVSLVRRLLRLAPSLVCPSFR